MSERKCRLWLVMDNGQVEKKYQLSPLSAAEIGADFVCGFRVVNRSEEPNPLYQVMVSPAGDVVCSCPAFARDKQLGDSPNAPPDQPPPSCKHCDALYACGLLPLDFVVLLAERTRLLDSVEVRIERLTKNRDLEREAACRNADALRSHAADLERQLRLVEGRALQLQTSLAAQGPAPRRRTRKVKAA